MKNEKFAIELNFCITFSSQSVLTIDCLGVVGIRFDLLQSLQTECYCRSLRSWVEYVAAGSGRKFGFHSGSTFSWRGRCSHLGFGYVHSYSQKSVTCNIFLITFRKILGASVAVIFSHAAFYNIDAVVTEDTENALSEIV